MRPTGDKRKGAPWLSNWHVYDARVPLREPLCDTSIVHGQVSIGNLIHTIRSKSRTRRQWCNTATQTQPGSVISMRSHGTSATVGFREESREWWATFHNRWQAVQSHDCFVAECDCCFDTNTPIWALHSCKRHLHAISDHRVRHRMHDRACTTNNNSSCDHHCRTGNGIEKCIKIGPNQTPSMHID